MDTTTPDPPPAPNPRCVRCGVELKSATPDGQCLACLLEDGIASTPAVKVAPELSTFDTGRTVGDYELLEEIARGGMGVVYKARQVSLSRTVALKMILSGQLAGPDDVQRFHGEAEAAANLKHPNIVAIHEVGECNGQHFFSMDYVEGRTLRQLTQDDPLPVPKAAGLIKTIAEAVHYAHEHGVVHRDLKPSNVLVDAGGQPHVTDFGLAKRIDAEGDLTLTGMVMGTPSYMSPEQAAGLSKSVGPLADVYALGAMLYDLLIGRPPFRGATPAETMAEAVNKEPLAPRLLNAGIPRDLETICLKCLAKEPHNRYASARELAEDIARHLNHEPIRAQPPSALYRARKFVRRHRVGVAVAAGFAVVLTAASAVSITYGWRATQAKLKEEAESKRATMAEKAANQRTREALKSQAESTAVLEFLTKHILSAARPEVQELGLGHDVTLRAAIEAAEVAIPTAFTNVPLIEARVRRTLGTTFEDLGDYAKAVQQFEKALALVERVHGSEHPGTVTALALLAQALCKAGRLREALAAGARLVPLSTQIHGRSHASTIEALGILGTIHLDIGSNELALANVSEAVSLARETLSTNHPVTLYVRASLANVYDRMKRYEDCLPLRQEVLLIRMQQFGPTNSATLMAQANLAALFQNMARYDEAIAMHEERLKFLKGKLEPDHPMVLAVMHNLGVACGLAKRTNEGLELLERTLKLRTSRLGADHPGTLQTMADLGISFSRAGRPAEAIPLFTNALQICDSKPGHRRDPWFRVMDELVDAYYALGHRSDAIATRERLLTATTEAYGREDRQTLYHLKDLAWSYLYYTNRFAEAETLFRELEAAQRKTGAAFSILATTLAQLALALLEQSKFAEAEPVIREAIPTFERNQPDRTSTFGTYYLLGWSLLGQKKYEEAETWLLKAHQGLTQRPAESRSSSEAHHLAETIRHLARLHEEWGKPAQEQARLLGASSTVGRPGATESQKYARADASYQNKQYVEAEALYREVLQSQLQQFPATNESCLQTAASLGRNLADWAWADRSSTNAAAAYDHALEAEHLLRDCFETRQRGTNSWRLADVKSRLGFARVVLAITDSKLTPETRATRFKDAEPLLRESAAALQAESKVSSLYKRDACDRLVRLYESWNKPTEAEHWRDKLR